MRRALAPAVALWVPSVAVRTAAADHGSRATAAGWSLEIWLFLGAALIVVLMVAWALLAPRREDADDEETRRLTQLLAAPTPCQNRTGAVSPTLRSLRCAGWRRTLAPILGGWLLVSLGAAAPHLVHHAFETDEAPDCAFLAGAEHAPADIEAPPAVERPVASGQRPTATALPLPPLPPARLPSSRIPPAAPLAVV